MKGTLHKTEQGWMVATIEEGDWNTYYPLHLDDVKQISADAQVFDNIEARIAAYPEVEFEIVEVFNKNEQVGYKYKNYAKLIKTGYPELEGTINLCNDITKKRTGKMTEEEWQAAERAQSFNKFTLMEETPGAPASDSTVMFPDVVMSGPQYIPEISDEEIYKASHREINHGGGSEGWIKAAFRQGAVWYREQLKQPKKD